MNRLLLIFLCCLSCSCRLKNENAKFVQAPVLYPQADYLKTTFDEVFFKEEHFSHAGGPHPQDTARYFYTSETTIIEDTAKRYLRNCEATLHNDSLLFQLSDLPFSSSFYEVKVVKIKDKFVAQYYQTFSVADSTYKLPVYKTINQEIILDKANYAKGDSLKGKLTLTILPSYSGENKFSDTIRVYGLIKTIVK